MRGIGDASKALARAAGAMELPIGDLERQQEEEVFVGWVPLWWGGRSVWR